MSSRNLTAVEGLRFFLFLGIFVFHCSSQWFPIGWVGVEAFLVITSYFLTSKYLQRERTEIKIRNAFLHRIKRLYPVYITIIGLGVFLSVVSKVGNPIDSLWYLFSAQNFRCLFMGNIGDWTSLDYLLGHFWYIALDVWLFLIWIVLLRIVPRSLYRNTFILALLLGLGWRTILLLLVPDNISLSYVFPIGMLDSFALGGLVALNVREKGHDDGIMWSEIFVGAVGVLLLTLYNSYLQKCSFIESYQLYHSAAGYMHNPLTGNTYLFVALFFAGILRYCINTTKNHSVLSATPLVVLGGLTYELFCFHFPIRYVVQHIISNEVLFLFVALLLTCIVSFMWKKYASPVVDRLLK